MKKGTIIRFKHKNKSIHDFYYDKRIFFVVNFQGYVKVDNYKSHCYSVWQSNDKFIPALIEISNNVPTLFIFYTLGSKSPWQAMLKLLRLEQSYYGNG